MGGGWRRVQKRVFLGCKKHSFSGSEEELKKPPADPKEEMWGGDGGGLQKSVFLGCKKHAFSGSEEKLKKPPADHKKKIFLRGDQKRIQKSGQRTSKRRCGGGMGEGPRSVFF